MGGVKRTRDGVDAIEHAFRGVHTTDNCQRIVSFDDTPGVVGVRSFIDIDVADDSPEEREVIVRLRDHSSRRRAG